jgi:hypothetical protein
MSYFQSSAQATLLSILSLFFLQASATAGVILSFGVGQTGGGSAQDPGISVVTPSGGPWNNITFNFYQSSAGASPGSSYAIGSLFLLSQVYAGTPQALSPSTSGFIAQAFGNGSVYTFSNSITLQPSTRYYFFAELGLTAGASTYVSSGSGDVTANLSYGSGNGNLNFTARPFDINFSLNGIVAGVPEPSSFAIFVVTGMAIHRIKRRNF